VITPVVQCWTHGRGSYRVAGEPIESRRYEVASIADDRTAKAFVVAHHYSGTYPAARFRFGLYRRHELVGVAVFSVPANPRSLAVLPGSAADSVELGCFVLVDDVPANGESWFLGRCFAQLRREGLAGVGSFSDPVLRTDAAGCVVFGGHLGTIYQAHNATYRGRSRAELRRVLPDGSVVHNRALTKIRNRRRGWRYAVAQLVRAGARPPRDRSRRRARHRPRRAGRRAPDGPGRPAWPGSGGGSPSGAGSPPPWPPPDSRAGAPPAGPGARRDRAPPPPPPRRAPAPDGAAPRRGPRGTRRAPPPAPGPGPGSACPRAGRGTPPAGAPRPPAGWPQPGLPRCPRRGGAPRHCAVRPLPRPAATGSGPGRRSGRCRSRRAAAGGRAFRPACRRRSSRRPRPARRGGDRGGARGAPRRRAPRDPPPGARPARAPRPSPGGPPDAPPGARRPAPGGGGPAPGRARASGRGGGRGARPPRPRRPPGCGAPEDRWTTPGPADRRRRLRAHVRGGSRPPF